MKDENFLQMIFKLFKIKNEFILLDLLNIIDNLSPHLSPFLFKKYPLNKNKDHNSKEDINFGEEKKEKQDIIKQDII